MPAGAAPSIVPSVPLCVDLDGTLIRTDLLWESLVRLLRHNPLWLLALPFWWARGRAHLKRQIAARVQPDPTRLPYCEPFRDFLKASRREGRRIILVTASDDALARRVAQHVGVFDEVLGSNGKRNLRGRAKLEALTAKFGPRGFDYAGNSSVDLPVWEGAREAIVVNARPSLVAKASRRVKLGPVFNEPKSTALAFLRALRPHQWVKNLILFVPLLTSHRLGETALLLNALWAFAAFSLCASGVYLLNDLMDLDADRSHATKRLRPLASGDLPLPAGLVLALLLLAAGLGLGALLSTSFLGVLGVYFVLTTAYSCRLKQVALLDVFVLAAIYTLRLVAGHEATGVAYSTWLLMFSIFIFLSLALVKRFQEVHALREANATASAGRGYTANDRELIASLGIGSGCLAALVLALYVNSQEVSKLYQHPTLLLLVCPLLLYWLSRVWMIAHRGQMHEDPVVFALQDRVSYLVGALTLAVLWLATGR